jgi:hypothetical protein
MEIELFESTYTKALLMANKEKESLDFKALFIIPQ